MTTTNGCPSFSASLALNSLAIWSVDPPGEKGTTIVTDLRGQDDG
ncbi:hypothetical protein [Bordetella pertussis]